MMRRAFRLLGLVALLAPSAAAADHWSFGAGFGVHLPSETAPYGIGATDHLEHLGADPVDWRAQPMSFTLTQSWVSDSYFGVQLRERLWIRATGGTFSQTPQLDFEHRVLVAPLTIAPQLVFDGKVLGIRLAAGLGAYLVSVEESGHLGDRSVLEARFGGHVTGAVVFRVSAAIDLLIDVTYDWFDLPRTNDLIEDGGPADGIGFGLLVEYRLQE
jgi:hypothetical protein